jgi:hypothetical protein
MADQRRDGRQLMEAESGEARCRRSTAAALCQTGQAKRVRSAIACLRSEPRGEDRVTICTCYPGPWPTWLLGANTFSDGPISDNYGCAKEDHQEAIMWRCELTD